MVFKKIIFQNTYVALETPSRPPPFMGNAILNFHLDFLTTSLILNQNVFDTFYSFNTLRSGVFNVEWIGFGWTNSKSDFSPHSTQGSCSDVIWNAAAHNLFVRCMAWSTATGVSSPFLEGFHFVMPKESLLEVSGWVDRC